MNYCTRKLLGLTDEKLFFEEEWLEIVGEEDFRTNFCLIEQPKQSYVWYVRTFTVKNVGRHSTHRQIWWMKTAVFQRA